MRPHEASLRPGIVGPGEPGRRVFESNFVMSCTCGDVTGYATRSERLAERWMREHLDRHVRLGEFQSLPAE